MTSLDDARDRLIFALDVEDEARARALAAALRPSVGTFKIGLELLMRGGMELARRLTDGSALFIDAKLHDVPATVSRAVAQIVDAGGIATDQDHAARHQTAAKNPIEFLDAGGLASFFLGLDRSQ